MTDLGEGSHTYGGLHHALWLWSWAIRGLSSWLIWGGKSHLWWVTPCSAYGPGMYTWRKGISIKHTSIPFCFWLWPWCDQLLQVHEALISPHDWLYLEMWVKINSFSLSCLCQKIFVTETRKESRADIDTEWRGFATTELTTWRYLWLKCRRVRYFGLEMF